MRRFPPRTLILMFLALAAFAWFYWNTHRPPPERRAPPANVQEVQVVSPGAEARDH